MKNFNKHTELLLKNNNISLRGDHTELYNVQCKSTISTKQGEFILIGNATNTIDI